MNIPDKSKDDLRVSQRLELDNICVRFERRPQADDGPSIEDHLKGSQEPLRSSLLEQLLLLELEHLSARNTTPDVQEYLVRFQRVIGN